MMLTAALLALLAQPSEPTPAACNGSNAVETSIAEIGSRPGDFVGRCVTVAGALSGRRLYSGREGIYLVSRAWEARTSSDAFHHRLGIDSQEMPGRSGHPVWTRVTGVLDSCERRKERMRQRSEAMRQRSEARGEVRVFTLGGYCHWEEGPVLVPSSYEQRDLHYERLTGEAARRRFGNLAWMPDQWRFRGPITQLARQFLVALRSGDREALESLYDGQIDPADLDYLLQDADSPFAQLRRAEPPQWAMFVTMAEDGSPLERAEADAVVCFCRSADCTDRWPISTFDAQNAPQRPYACTRVTPRDWTARGFGLDRPALGGWMFEPAASVFRP